MAGGNSPATGIEFSFLIKAETNVNLAILWVANKTSSFLFSCSLFPPQPTRTKKQARTAIAFFIFLSPLPPLSGGLFLKMLPKTCRRRQEKACKPQRQRLSLSTKKTQNFFFLSISTTAPIWPYIRTIRIKESLSGYTTVISRATIFLRRVCCGLCTGVTGKCSGRRKQK